MHDTSRTKPSLERLFHTASEQGGYFTAAQAQAAGYSWALLAHHSKSGRFIRVRRGLYRIREYPSSPRENVVAAQLAAGADVALVSHESALDILGLSDVVPEVVHLTVPRSRRYRPTSAGVAVHTTTRPISGDEVVVRDGIRVSAPARAIVDAADAGTAPEQILAAIAQALDRGMTTESQLLHAARERGGRVKRLVARAIDERKRTE